jgi:hypothetical protein
MEKVEVKVELAKEAYELAEAIKGLIVTARVALKDGFQPVVDIPVLLGANMGALLKGVEGLEKLPAEAKEDLAPVAKAFALAGADLAALFAKK